MSCSVLGCGNKPEILSGVVLYILPIGNTERCKQWLTVIRNPMYDVNTPPDKYGRPTIYVCSRHFKPEDFKNDLEIQMLRADSTKQHRPSLKEDAVPSLFKWTADKQAHTPGNEDKSNHIEAVLPDDRPRSTRKPFSASEFVITVKGEKRDPSHKQGQLCPECGIFFDNPKAHTCEFKSKPYSCNLCGKRFVNEKCLKIHSKKHEDGNIHHCQFCAAKFKTVPDKQAHEQTHISKRPYQCPECPETFSNALNRKLHLRSHTTCPVCKKEFTLYCTLKRHMAVHTGAKPFACDFCRRSFSQESHLKSHIRLHTGEKPFKCLHCEKSFNHNVSLKSHIQRYHGEESGFEPPQSENNEDHINTSSGNNHVDRNNTKQWKRRSTGRPKGRPKKNA